MTAYNPQSASDTYVIYDQFHFGEENHLEVPAKGRKYALSVYRFLKELHPNMSIGLATIEYYKLKVKK